MSEQKNELYTALAKAQGSIRNATKDATGQYENGYATLSSILDACRNALSENGIAVIQRPDFNETEKWIETILAHSSGQALVGRYPVRPTKDDPQGNGSAMTYARKYSLASMVGVAPEDDDAEEASSKDTTPPPLPNRKSAHQARKDKDWEVATKGIDLCLTPDEVNEWFDSNNGQLANHPWAKDLRAYGEEHKKSLDGWYEHKVFVDDCIDNIEAADSEDALNIWGQSVKEKTNALPKGWAQRVRRAYAQRLTTIKGEQDARSQQPAA